MISEIGDLSLGGAVLVAAGAVLASIASVRFRSAGLRTVTRWAIALVALLFTVASAALLTALIKSDFRFDYVVSYTERALPMGYKFAAFWAGQEGSLLLWAWVLAALSVVAVFTFRRLEGTADAIAMGTLAAVNGFFAALMLFAANPFTYVEGAAPLDGRGLNPMLQDPGMIIHPPLLFIGYAGFTVPFAVLVGVLVARRSDNHWIAQIRRWVLVSWGFLTAGIVLGAWWAYVELGWGGYWAWDPVENASLLPWFTGTALLHTAIVQAHRGMFKVWTAVLIALSFILCVFGTYLTRSGVVSSVHAFAPSLIATFFLWFLAITTAGTLVLILWRRKLLRSEHVMEGLISREGAFLATSVLLMIMMVTTLLGTIFPIISGLFMEEVTVGPPFYNKVVAPMGVLLVAIMAVGPVLVFGKSAASKIAHSLIVPGILAAIVTVVLFFTGVHNLWALICTAIATLGTFTVIVSFLRSVAARRKSTGENPIAATIRLVDRDHRRYGGQFAHLGMMMIVIGVAGSSVFSHEEIFRVSPGDAFEVEGHRFTFERLDQIRDVNFTAFEGKIRLALADGSEIMLLPQCRFYDTWGREPNTEVSVRSSWREDIYVSVVGWEDLGQTTAIQVRINPLVIWIWIGGIVVTAGALFCILPPLLPRRAHARAPVAVYERGKGAEGARPAAVPAHRLQAKVSS